MAESCTFRPRPREVENEIDEKGAFVRQKNRFDAPFGDGPDDLKAEAGRYRLIWAKGCNWSNRSSIVRELLGLEDAISVDIVDRAPHEEDLGWEFVNDKDGRDPVLGVRFLSELYANADPSYKGRATVPSLVDIRTKKVVNNDYHRLTNYLEVAFRPFHKQDAPDLYPEELRGEIDDFNVWLFHNVNNGVYKCAFAQSISAYNDAFTHFYDGLALLEKRLDTRRFLFGDFVTDSDVRLFVTLARFDIFYYRNMGPAKGRIVDYKNLWGYARDLYQIPAFRHNTYLRDIAESHRDQSGTFVDYNTRFWNQIDFDALWGAPHGREILSLYPEQKFRIELN